MSTGWGCGTGWPQATALWNTVSGPCASGARPSGSVRGEAVALGQIALVTDLRCPTVALVTDARCPTVALVTDARCPTVAL
jgi:hypothetical protein